MRVFKEKTIPIYGGPSSVKPAGIDGKGRTVEWVDDNTEEERAAFVDWAPAYKRKYRIMRDPDDGHILTDQEIDHLINMINHGWRSQAFTNTKEFLRFLTYRNQLPEQAYGSFDADVSVVRFFDVPKAEREKAENILADIRALNEKEQMGNVKIPGTSIEIINYSPCPTCGHLHSFKDVFNYYLHPVNDPRYPSRREQYANDTRVQCIECGAFFLPALIIADGSPVQEHQMICRAQTLRSVSIYFNDEYQLPVLYNKKSNLLTTFVDGKEKRAWRNDINANLLKPRPALFSNLLQYTPAPLMLDFLAGKNLQVEEPIYGVWQEPHQVHYVEM